MAVSAADIAPKAYGKSTTPSHEAEDASLDLRNLSVLNPHPLEASKVSLDKEQYLQDVAQEATQILVAGLFNLETEPSDVGPLAILPKVCTTVLPREKKIPEPKAETRWEKFAKEKGIDGRKKSRKVWDEDMQEWRPNWGYGRANDGIMNHAIVEIKEGADPEEDPWSKARGDKRARVNKNLLNQARNMERSGKGRERKNALRTAGIPVDLDASSGKSSKKRGRDGTKAALTMVQQSTASMGKFDSKRDGEPGKRSKKARQSFKPVVQDAASEQQASMKILNAVMINKNKTKGEARASSKASLAAYDAVEGDPDKGAKKKKGKGAQGKFKKITKKRSK
ncbi:unnamed protein product [Chrysoparadoxa australica]